MYIYPMKCKWSPLLLLFVFILQFRMLSAQTVFPSAASNARWNVGEWFWDDGDLIQYTIDHDTLLCGFTYSVVGNGMIRTEGEKVFIKMQVNCDDPEYLLYDFGALPGERIWTKGYNSPTDTMEFRVDSVETVLYFGVPRKQLTVAYDRCLPEVDDVFFNTMHWIEGIGSDVHPFYPFYCLCDACETSANLQCFDSSGVQLFGIAEPLACDIVIPLQTFSPTALRVYPDPARESISVYLPVNGIVYYKIKTVSGADRVSGILEPDKTIAIGGLSSGYYILEMEAESGALRYYSRFIKL